MERGIECLRVEVAYEVRCEHFSRCSRNIVENGDVRAAVVLRIVLGG